MVGFGRGMGVGAGVCELSLLDEVPIESMKEHAPVRITTVASAIISEDRTEFLLGKVGLFMG